MIHKASCGLPSCKCVLIWKNDAWKYQCRKKLQILIKNTQLHYNPQYERLTHHLNMLNFLQRNQPSTSIGISSSCLLFYCYFSLFFLLLQTGNHMTMASSLYKTGHVSSAILTGEEKSASAIGICALFCDMDEDCAQAVYVEEEEKCRKVVLAKLNATDIMELVSRNVSCNI